MFDSILVPLDGSPLADAILVHVLSIVEGTTVRLHLVGVGDHGLGEHLERLAAGIAGTGHEVVIDRREGDAAEQILAAADAIEPGLVALSTHGRTGLVRVRRGSVAERVLRHSRHPVLLSNPHRLVEAHPHRATWLERILVPVDGSPASVSILALAATFARRYEAAIVLQHVVDLVEPASMVDIEERVLAPHRAALAAGGLVVRTRVDVDRPAGAILDAIGEERAGLVAMTTHGRSGPSRWVFGSVAETVLRHCPVPLLVHRTG